MYKRNSPEDIIRDLKATYDYIFKIDLEEAMKSAFQAGERSARDHVYEMAIAAKKLEREEEKKHV